MCFSVYLCISVRVCVYMCVRQTSLGGTKVEQGWLGATAAKWEAFDAALLVTDTHTHTHTFGRTVIIITSITLVIINLTKHLPVSVVILVIIIPSEGNRSTHI